MQPSQTLRSEELRNTFDEAGQQSTADDDDDHQIINGRRSPNTKAPGPIQQYWIRLATAIDRIAFIVYFVVFFVLTIAYAF